MCDINEKIIVDVLCKTQRPLMLRELHDLTGLNRTTIARTVYELASMDKVTIERIGMARRVHLHD